MLFLLAVVALFSAYGETGLAREAEMKARLVGSLGKLVTWPSEKAPSATKPLTIGIVGRNPFVDASGVDHLKRTIPSAKILSFATAAQIKDCHILFVAKNANFKAALAKTAMRPVLVVTESPGLAEQGAAINLVQQDNRIRLELNPKSVTQAGLRMKSALLNSSLVVIVQPPPAAR
jgi:hypothetical protein